MTAINNADIATSDLLVTVKRIDSPRIKIGVHEYAGARYLRGPQLMSRSDAVQKINAFLDEGFEEIDAFQVSMIDPEFYNLVKGSLAIGFHRGWIDGDPEMLDRIRVFVLPSGTYEPSRRHCSKELRFRDAAGLDGGGSVQCLSELYENGTCPKTSLHHDVFYANRSRTECYYGESHGAGCTH